MLNSAVDYNCFYLHIKIYLINNPSFWFNKTKLYLNNNTAISIIFWVMFGLFLFVIVY